MSLTAPQRNCLLAIYRSHPEPYSVRGAALLPRRLVLTGAVEEVTGLGPSKRFRLTPFGLERAARLAARRDADHAAAGLSDGAAATHPTPAARPAGMPSDWPFQVSGHCWPLEPVVHSPSKRP